MSRTSTPRSVCPVACTLDILGDRWTLLVIRDLFAGKTQFKEFASSPEGIASNILTSRLNRLVEEGLVERVVDPAQSGHPAYRLTPKGRSIRPVLASMAEWGLKNVKGTKIKIKVE